MCRLSTYQISMWINFIKYLFQSKQRYPASVVQPHQNIQGAMSVATFRLRLLVFTSIYLFLYFICCFGFCCCCNPGCIKSPFFAKQIHKRKSVQYSLSSAFNLKCAQQNGNHSIFIENRAHIFHRAKKKINAVCVFVSVCILHVLVLAFFSCASLYYAMI